MRQNEKNSMLEVYKEKFNWYLSSQSEIAENELRGMKTILETVISSEDINRAENECRIENKYTKETLINFEYLLKRLGINYLLTWEIKDIDFIYDEAQFHSENDPEAWNCLKACYNLIMNEVERGKVA